MLSPKPPVRFAQTKEGSPRHSNAFAETVLSSYRTFTIPTSILIPRSASRRGAFVSRIWDALKLAQKQRARTPLSTDFDPLASPEYCAPAATSEVDRRASDRTAHSFLILVYGSDADHQPFHEETETLDFTDAGCSLTLETPVSPGQRLFLTNMDNGIESEARVADVSRSTSGKSRVGLAFARPLRAFWSRP